MKRKTIKTLIICCLSVSLVGCGIDTSGQAGITKDTTIQNEISDVNIQDTKPGISYQKVYPNGEAIINEEYQRQLREKYASYKVIEAIQDDDYNYLYNGEIIPFEDEDIVWEDTDFSPDWQASAIQLSNGYILSHELFNTDICKFISELSAAATLKEIRGTDSPKASIISEGDILSTADVKELVKDCKAFQSVKFLFYDNPHNIIEIHIYPFDYTNRHEKRTLSVSFKTGSPNYIICESKQIKIASNPIGLNALEVFAYYEMDPEIMYYD